MGFWMPSNLFAPGDICACQAIVCNAGSDAVLHLPLFVILDVAFSYFFAPSFSEYDNYLDDFSNYPYGTTIVEVLPPVAWPEGAGIFNGCMLYGALTDQNVSQIIGELDTWEFGWTE
jgi:hypothetical protein